MKQLITTLLLVYLISFVLFVSVEKVKAADPQYYTSPIWQVGQWVEYSMSEDNVIPCSAESGNNHIADNRKTEGSTIKISVVGTENIDGKPYYWYEFKQTKPGYWNTYTAGVGEDQWNKYPEWVAQTRTVIVKMLVDGPEFKDIRRYQIKIDGETAKEYTDQHLASLPEEIKNLLGKRPLMANILLMEGSNPAYDNCITGYRWSAQKVKAISDRINGVSLDLMRVAGQNYDLEVELYNNGGDGFPGISLGKQIIPYTEVSTAAGGLVDAVFTWPIPTKPNEYYHIVAHTATSEPGDNLVYYWKVTDISTSTYSDGTSENHEGIWSAPASGRDFKIAVMHELGQEVQEDIIVDSGDTTRDNVIGGNWWAAQEFKLRKASNIFGVALDVKRLENYDLVVELRGDNNGLPGKLLRSKVILYQLVSSDGKVVRVDFDEPLAVSAGGVYHLVAHTIGNQGTSGGSYYWRLTNSASSTYADGEEETSTNGGSGWGNSSGRDLVFVVLESDPSEAGWTLIKPTNHLSDVAIIDRCGDYDNAIGGTSSTAQEFNPNQSNITAVTLDIKRGENYNLVVELYNDSSGLPGTSLANKVVPYNRVSQKGGFLTVFFDVPISIIAQNPYHIVLHTENNQGTSNSSYYIRVGDNNYSIYPYGEQEIGTSGSFYNGNGRDFYLVTHYLNPEAQEVVNIGGVNYNTDRVVSNRGAVKSWFSNTVPVTGIVKRKTTEGVGIQRADNSIEIKQDEITGNYRDNLLGGNYKCAQQVTPTTSQVSGISFNLKRLENYDVVAEVTDDYNGLPSSNILASKTIPYSQISTTGDWIDIFFDQPVTTVPGAAYHFVLRTALGGGTNGESYHVLLTDLNSTYGYGEEEYNQGYGWYNVTGGRDFAFQLRYARQDRVHNSYQELVLSNSGTGASSEISNPIELSLKSAVANSDGNVVNSSILLGGYRQDDQSSASKQQWLDAGANHTPQLNNYDEGSTDRTFVDGKPYFYGAFYPWQFDLYDKWRSGFKGQSWQEEPYNYQSEANRWFTTADSEEEAASKYVELNKWYLVDRYKYWDGSLVPSFDGSPYGVGYALTAGADGVLMEEWIQAINPDFLDGITFNDNEVLKIINAALRGVARNYGKIMWGRGVYPDVISLNKATTALKLTYDEGGNFLFYWTYTAAEFDLAKTSMAELRAHVNARRQSEYLPERVLLLPKDLGYYGVVTNHYSWGIGWDASVTMKWEEYHWKDILQDFYAKAKELLNSGIPFDSTFDDGSFKSYLYPCGNIYRFNGTEGNWWNTGWNWQQPVSFGKNTSSLGSTTIVRVAVDFESKLKQKGISNPDLDENSIRVVTYDRSTNTFSLISSSRTQFVDTTYNGEADAANNGRGDVKFKLGTTLAANTSRIYYIYFDITANGNKPSWGSSLGTPTASKLNSVRLPQPKP